MRLVALAGLFLLGCSVNYRANEAEYQCRTYGRCGGNGGSGGGNVGTGGSGGLPDGGGTGGTGGDASADVATVESCTTVDAGFCRNPDTAHCTAHCENTDSGPVCVVEGVDVDDDKHGSALCTAATVLADDCDDGLQGVHPGSQEICNGIDDDCDGRTDLDDGLSLGGTTNQFAPHGDGNQAIRWSETSGVYGVAWTDRAPESVADGGTTTRSHLHFTALDDKGALVNGADADLTAAGEDDLVSDMAAGSDDFRVLSTSNGGTKLYSREIHYALTGITSNTRNYLADIQGYTRPTIVEVGGFSLATWFEFSGFSFNSTGVVLPLLADGTAPGPADKVPLNAYTQPDLASARGGLFAGYAFVQCSIPGVGDAAADAGSPCYTMLNVTDFSVTPGKLSGPFLVSAPGAKPVSAGIASNGSQFVVAWTENDPNGTWSLVYSVVSPNGTVVCGPKQYLTRPGIAYASLSYREAPSITALADGSFVAVVPYDAKQLLLAKLDTTCSNVETTPLVVSSQIGFIGTSRVAASSASVVVLWRDWFGSGTQLRIRKMSPLLCGAP